MKLLFNVTLAWISVALLVALSIIYLLRIVNKYFFNNQNAVLKKWNKHLRKHHKWMGIMIIITGLLHGILSSFSLLSFNMGTLLLVVFILLALSFILRKIFARGTTWIKFHRILTGFAFVLLVLHLVEVGGFVGIDGIKAAIANDPLQNNTKTNDETKELTPVEDNDESSKNEAISDAEGSTNKKDDILTGETSADTVTADDTVTSGDTVTSNDSATSDENTTTSSTSGPYIDGTYTGMADGFRPGLTVQVVIENGYIASVDVVAHNEKNQRFYGKPIAVVPEEIVAAQSTDVDIVTGATFTSNGIKNAVNNALENALK